jgi:hypothetical protein
VCQEGERHADVDSVAACEEGSASGGADGVGVVFFESDGVGGEGVDDGGFADDGAFGTVFYVCICVYECGWVGQWESVGECRLIDFDI